MTEPLRKNQTCSSHHENSWTKLSRTDNDVGLGCGRWGTYVAPRRRGMFPSGMGHMREEHSDVGEVWGWAAWPASVGAAAAGRADGSSWHILASSNVALCCDSDRSSSILQSSPVIPQLRLATKRNVA